jgi:hypothetical protein
MSASRIVSSFSSRLDGWRAPADVCPEAAIAKVVADPAASDWLRLRLREALLRDPLDAAEDAEVLAALLRARADRVLEVAAADLDGRAGHAGPSVRSA